ncbi:hypothetical protein LIQ27_22600, partial [Bacteroides fragilis]|uniref:hypothetical protein n=1 Tax=Bacteroides fragilis TaxID=817 RepID=UPI001D034071
RFPNLFFLQEQIRWCKRNGIEHSEFVSLSQKFTNPTYEKYLILDWDRFRDKESYDFENHQEYEKLKEEEIRKSFSFNNIKEIELFYNTFHKLG